MASDDTLPIILVSAADTDVAEDIISEVIEATEGGAVGPGPSRRWGMCNKYYSAVVLLWPQPDSAPPPARIAHRVEAHLVLLGDGEGPVELERRVQGAGAAADPAHCHVRLVLCRTRQPCLIHALARHHGYELVPPAPAPAPAPAPGEGEAGGEGEGESDEAGLPRVRAALHAHTWPNLRLHPRARGAVANGHAEPEPEGEREGEGEDDEEAALRRAEAFADALEALGEARGGAGGGRGGGGGRAGGDGERLQRAEALVASFCTALGLNPRDL